MWPRSEPASVIAADYSKVRQWLRAKLWFDEMMLQFYVSFEPFDGILRADRTTADEEARIPFERVTCDAPPEEV